jgi:hypothetical protein
MRNGLVWRHNILLERRFAVAAQRLQSARHPLVNVHMRKKRWFDFLTTAGGLPTAANTHGGRNSTSFWESSPWLSLLQLT